MGSQAKQSGRFRNGWIALLRALLTMTANPQTALNG
jgi:hypothetical protein